MLTVMVRCQAPTTKHMGLLIAHINPRRETTKSAHSNRNRYVDSSRPKKVRRLYITGVAFARLLNVCPHTHTCDRALLFGTNALVMRLAQLAFAPPYLKATPESAPRYGPNQKLGFCNRPYSA